MCLSHRKLLDFINFICKEKLLFFFFFFNYATVLKLNKNMLKHGQASFCFKSAKLAEAIGPIVFNVTHSC